MEELIFSDESKFSILDSARRIKVWCKIKRYLPECTVKQYLTVSCLFVFR